MFEQIFINRLNKIESMRLNAMNYLDLNLSIDKAYAKSMLSFPSFKFDVMLENGRNNDFFKNLHKKINHFDIVHLRKIEKLFGENYSEVGSLASAIEVMNNSVDFLFSPFLEGISALPLFFTNENIDLNCVGKAITLAILYSYDHDINDLVAIEITSTKRFDDIVNTLRELRKGNHVIIDENSSALLSDSKQIISNPLYKDLMNMTLKMAGRLVYIDVDVFHGLFLKEVVEEMLLEHALSLDFFNHIQIKNLKTKEVYDYPLEVGKEKRYNILSVEEGIQHATILAFLNMYTLLYPLQEIVESSISFLKNTYPNFEDNFLFLGNMTRLYFLLNKTKEVKTYVERILDLTKDNLPINWLIVALSLGIKEESFVKEYINEKVGHPEAFEKAKLRYFDML